MITKSFCIPRARLKEPNQSCGTPASRQIRLMIITGAENVTLFLSWPVRPIIIKHIHHLHLFKFSRIEYLTVNDNSNLLQFNLSLAVYFFLLV